MIIGLTGTAGSGKGTVAEILKANGFYQLVMSDILREECRKEGIEETRDNLLSMGNKLRAKFGSGILMKMLIEKAKMKGFDNVIIDGVRSTGEVEELKKVNGLLIAVDAPLKDRYERNLKRGTSKDNISFEEFKKQEKNEIGKPGAQLDKCLSVADYKIINNGTFDELKEKVRQLLTKLK